jgi:Flp pilus assembly protein TadD
MLKPDYGLAHVGLGKVRREEGRFEEAIRHFGDALRFDPRDADAHYHLATVLGLQGRLEEAVAHYRQALQIDGANAPARLELADVEKKLRANRR